MKTTIIVFTILALSFFVSNSFSQQRFYMSFTPFDKTIIAGNDAKANGYYNRFRDEIIYVTQSKSKINRQLLDTNFLVKRNYSVSDKDISLNPAKRKATFLNEFSTTHSNFEVYLSKKV